MAGRGGVQAGLQADGKEEKSKCEHTDEMQGLRPIASSSGRKNESGKKRRLEAVRRRACAHALHGHIARCASRMHTCRVLRYGMHRAMHTRTRACIACMYNPNARLPCSERRPCSQTQVMASAKATRFSKGASHPKSAGSASSASTPQKRRHEEWRTEGSIYLGHGVLREVFNDDDTKYDVRGSLKGWLPPEESDFKNETTGQRAALWRVVYEDTSVGEEDLEEHEVKQAIIS